MKARAFFTPQLIAFSVLCLIVALGPVVVDAGREWQRPVVWLMAVLAYRWREQLVFRPSPVRAERTGEWLFPLVYIGVTGSVLFPAIEFAVDPRPWSPVVSGIGLALALFGSWLRVRAIDTLGEQLSTHLEIRPDHRLVDHGVFRLVRHPGTTGAMVFLLGAALILQAWYSVIWVVGFLWTVLFIRMGVEERDSAARLPGYREYMARTKRIIPFVY
ncbi:MAG: methyltransferase family protein [Gemmatimonadota bacterium]